MLQCHQPATLVFFVIHGLSFLCNKCYFGCIDCCLTPVLLPKSWGYNTSSWQQTDWKQVFLHFTADEFVGTSSVLTLVVFTEMVQEADVQSSICAAQLWKQKKLWDETCKSFHNSLSLCEYLCFKSKLIFVVVLSLMTQTFFLNMAVLWRLSCSALCFQLLRVMSTNKVRTLKMHF